MPKFLERKLKAEYPNNPHAVYGTMNAIGAMHGNKETAKGRKMEEKHEAKIRETHIQHHGDGSHTVTHHMAAKPAGKSGAFSEAPEPESYSASNHKELMSKLAQHLGVAPESDADGDDDGDE